MEQTTPSDLFPRDFPPELIREALVHLSDVAWRPKLAAVSVEWLGAHGYAVLGTEVWLPKQGMIQSIPYFQAIREIENESWDSFVARAAAETLAYLKEFEGRLTEEGDVFVNVSWVNDQEFRSLKAGAARK
jgi:hypothetical protein